MQRRTLLTELIPGLISRFNVLEDGVSIGLGPTVQGMLSFLESQGRDVALVTAEFSEVPPPP